MALILVVLLSCSWLASCRYLPTRSDPTNREKVKELIRELLDGIPASSLAREDYNSDPRPSFPYEYQHASSIAKRSIHEPNRSFTSQLSKQ